MKNKSKNSEFFELLRLNDNLELKKWLISKGKSGKVTSPVMFKKKEEEKEK